MGVSRVGIVGAGTMGQGIATACAGAGFEVLLSDRAADIATRGVEEIAQHLDRDIAKWRHTPSEKKAILGRLRAVDGLQPLERANLVIEDAAVHGSEAEISHAGAIARVFVVPTNEELLIARDTCAIVSGG